MEFDADYFKNFYKSYKGQNPPRKLQFYLSTIERFAQLTATSRLLDVGCGLGSFLEYVHGCRPYALSGTDVSAYGLEENRKRLPGVDFVAASAEEAPFPAAQFDVITALDVIEHVPDLSRVKASFLQMLKPGGIACVVVPVYDGLSGPIITALDRDPTHVHKNGRRFWLQWGSEDLKMEHWTGMIRYFFPFGYYLHIPTHLLRWHSPAILMILRKPLAM